MQVDDFCAMSPAEFATALAMWGDDHEAAERAAWERTRTLAAISVQPHISRRLTPRQLLPLPWDGRADERPVSAAKEMTRAEHIARMRELENR